MSKKGTVELSLDTLIIILGFTIIAVITILLIIYYVKSPMAHGSSNCDWICAWKESLTTYTPAILDNIFNVIPGFGCGC